MAKITNNTRETLNFVTGVKDGAAVTESLKAGQTADLAVDENDAQLRGRVAAGLISIEGALAPAPAAEGRPAPAAAERRTAATLGGDAAIRN